MSDESTASLRIKYESVGDAQVKKTAAEMAAASIATAKIIVANSAIVKQATLADIKIESAARVAAVKNVAALQILEVKKANALELMERKNAAAQAIALEKTKQKEIAAAQKPSSGMFSKDSWAGYVTGVNQAIALTQRFGGMLMGMANNAAVWDSYRIALETMEGGARQAERAIADLYEIAKAPGIDQEGAQKAYLQFRALNIEGGKAKEMIKAFSNAVALGGGSSVEFNRVNIQLRQMLSNNRVLESDLRFMKESMPMLAKVMQDTFGTSTAEGIRNLGLSAGEFVEGILVGLEKLPKAQQNLKSEIENTANAWSILKAAMVDTEAAGKFFNSWTTAFENLTAVIKAESINWKTLLGDGLWAYIKAGGPLTGLYSVGKAVQSTNAEKVVIDPKKEAVARINGIYDVMAEAVYNRDKAEGTRSGPIRINAAGRLDSQGMTREQALAAWYRNNPDVGSTSGITDLGDLPKPPAKPPAKPPKTGGRAVNPLDVVGDKRYLTVDQLQGRNLLEAQAAIDKALMAERDKANKEAEKQREEALKAETKAHEDYVKAMIDSRDAQREADKKANEDRINALQELREAEAGEYELRLMQADSWAEQMKAKVGNDEAAITRITEVQARKRAEVYADAWVNILGNSSNFFGSMANLSRQFDEDNTREYAKWVAIQQSLAIASATINIAVAMSNALRNGFTTLDGLAQMATVAAAGGQILSSIAAMNAAKVGKGAFDKGGNLGYGEWGIAGENGAEIVEGPARITSTRDTARALAGKSSVNVNVHNYAGASVDVRQRDDGGIDVIIDKIADQLEDRFASNIASGTGSLNKAVRGTYGLRRSGR